VAERQATRPRWAPTSSAGTLDDSERVQAELKKNKKFIMNIKTKVQNLFISWFLFFKNTF
jgi:hypothetical protein